MEKIMNQNTYDFTFLDRIPNSQEFNNSVTFYFLESQNLVEEMKEYVKIYEDLFHKNFYIYFRFYVCDLLVTVNSNKTYKQLKKKDFYNCIDEMDKYNSKKFYSNKSKLNGNDKAYVVRNIVNLFEKNDILFYISFFKISPSEILSNYKYDYFIELNNQNLLIILVENQKNILKDDEFMGIIKLAVSKSKNDPFSLIFSLLKIRTSLAEYFLLNIRNKLKLKQILKIVEFFTIKNPKVDQIIEDLELSSIITCLKVLYKKDLINQIQLYEMLTHDNLQINFKRKKENFLFYHYLKISKLKNEKSLEEFFNLLSNYIDDKGPSRIIQDLEYQELNLSTLNQKYLCKKFPDFTSCKINPNEIIINIDKINKNCKNHLISGKDKFAPILDDGVEYIKLSDDHLDKKIKIIDSDETIKDINLLTTVEGKLWVGFDSEWLMENIVQNNPSNICDIFQISNGDITIIIDFYKFKSHKAIISQLETVLEKAEKILCFSLKGDLAKCPSELQSIFRNYQNKVWDLHTTFNALIDEKKLVPIDGKKSLASLCRVLIGKDLCKNETLSNWQRRPLRKSQIHYAALDAYILIDLGKNLVKLKEKENNTIVNSAN